MLQTYKQSAVANVQELHLTRNLWTRPLLRYLLSYLGGASWVLAEVGQVIIGPMYVRIALKHVIK
jgi:hypothetical protein